MKLHDFSVLILLFYLFLMIPDCSKCTSLGERIGRRVTLSWHPHDPSPPPPSSTDHDYNHSNEMPVEPDDSSFCGTYDWMEKRSGDRKDRQILNGGFQRTSASPPDALNRFIGQDGVQRYSSTPLRPIDGSHIRGSRSAISR